MDISYIFGISLSIIGLFFSFKKPRNIFLRLIGINDEISFDKNVNINIPNIILKISNCESDIIKIPDNVDNRGTKVKCAVYDFGEESICSPYKLINLMKGTGFNLYLPSKINNDLFIKVENLSKDFIYDVSVNIFCIYSVSRMEIRSIPNKILEKIIVWNEDEFSIEFVYEDMISLQSLGAEQNIVSYSKTPYISSEKYIDISSIYKIIDDKEKMRKIFRQNEYNSSFLGLDIDKNNSQKNNHNDDYNSIANQRVNIFPSEYFMLTQWRNCNNINFAQLYHLDNIINGNVSYYNDLERMPTIPCKIKRFDSLCCNEFLKFKKYLTADQRLIADRLCCKGSAITLKQYFNA